MNFFCFVFFYEIIKFVVNKWVTKGGLTLPVNLHTVYIRQIYIYVASSSISLWWYSDNLQLLMRQHPGTCHIGSPTNHLSAMHRPIVEVAKCKLYFEGLFWFNVWQAFTPVFLNCSQFHQHFTRAFYVQKFVRSQTLSRAKLLNWLLYKNASAQCWWNWLLVRCDHWLLRHTNVLWNFFRYTAKSINSIYWLGGIPKYTRKRLKQYYMYCFGAKTRGIRPIGILFINQVT